MRRLCYIRGVGLYRGRVRAWGCGEGKEATDLRGCQGMCRLSRRGRDGAPMQSVDVIQPRQGLRRPGQTRVQGDRQAERHSPGAATESHVPGLSRNGRPRGGLGEGRRFPHAGRGPVREVPWAWQRVHGRGRHDRSREGHGRRPADADRQRLPSLPPGKGLARGGLQPACAGYSGGHEEDCPPDTQGRDPQPSSQAAGHCLAARGTRPTWASTVVPPVTEAPPWVTSSANGG